MSKNYFNMTNTVHLHVNPHQIEASAEMFLGALKGILGASRERGYKLMYNHKKLH